MSSQKHQYKDIGGQAVMEGVMMQSPSDESIAIAVRRPNGKIMVTCKHNEPLSKKHKWMGLPFIRGCVTFIDSMIKGMQALTYSAELVPVEEQEPDKLDQWIEKHFSAEKASKIIIGTAVVLGIALALFLFIVLPTLIVGLIKPLTQNLVLRNLSEGVVKIIILLAYMRLCCCVSDVKRLFSYHGAEHKTIFCYEHGKPLTVENVRTESRFHPRCGTSFLLVVVVVSILVNSVVTLTNSFARMGAHLLLLPVVVGISYEINLWCGRHDNRLSAFLSAPGKWLQHMTTNEPDDGMIECAIRAMELVIPEKKGSDAW